LRSSSNPLPSTSESICDPTFSGRERTRPQLTAAGGTRHLLGLVEIEARDVGEAMARNPVALIIPCYRVLAAGGKIGGFSAPGGSGAKKRMLALEGVRLDPPPPAQQSFQF
jgi:methylated-DNA-[protein]-cysteine S-methyltransferase